MVVISEDGAVYAETNVNSITIGGTFEGDIKASKEFVVLSTGKCTGKVECKDLVVEAGQTIVILGPSGCCITG